MRLFLTLNMPTPIASKPFKCKLNIEVIKGYLGGHHCHRNVLLLLLSLLLLLLFLTVIFSS